MAIAYLDNSATTPLYDEAADLMASILKSTFGNPSSLHRLGLEAEKLISNARESASELLGCNTNEFYFTGSGTESDNIAIFGTALTKKNAGKRIITTALEHPAAENSFLALKDLGFEIITVFPRDGKIQNEDILKEITKDTILVSCMHVNNETGEILPLDGIKDKMKSIGSRGYFHTDVVQSFGKLSNVLDYSPDLVSVSAHKIHGPKGVGGLYIKKGVNLISPVCGGGQEKNIRSGTENTAGIAGFGKAAEIKKAAMKSDYVKVSGLCNRLIDELKALTFQTVIQIPENHLPYVLNFAVPALKSEVLLHYLESTGVYVSSGSACSSRKNKGSKVLTAMGLSKEITDSSVRVSFSGMNTEEDIQLLVSGIKSGYASLTHKK